MKAIRLTVNGKSVTAEVEPRLQLADFLREHLLLTGTHLGCEHGVCGACTVELDGVPARSCIAYAVACNGANVRTIEGFDDDLVMAELREAFSAKHALQCGYCTPGMLVTARDIVLRLPDADEPRIRKELAGNLCRCTGYVGIVLAIRSVIAERKAKGRTAPGAERSVRHEIATASLPTPRDDPPHGHCEERRDEAIPRRSQPQPAASSRRTLVAETSPESVRPERRPPAPESKPQSTLHQSFTVDHPRDTVWEFFGRLDEVTTCLPGTAVLGMPTDDHVEIKMRVKVGPIVAEFQGAADVVRDPSSHSGVIRGSARDSRSGSATRGEVRYVLLEENRGAATRVDIDVGFTLTGALAQFSRSGLVHDIARRMTAAFAQNLETRLNQPGADRSIRNSVPALDAGSLFFSVIWNRIQAFFRSLWRKT